MNEPAAPYVGLIIEDAADDWVTTDDDPENITWANYTEGTEALILIHQRLDIQPITGVKAQHIGAGISYDQKYGKRYYLFTVSGYVDSLTDADYIDQFLMDDKHTTGTGFERPYLVVCLDENVYKHFTDENNARKEYCACNLLGGKISNSDSDNLIWNYVIQGVSVWR